MYKKIIMATVTVGTLLVSQVLHAADTYDNKKTTTVEQTTVQTTSTAPKPAPKKPAPAPVTTTTSNTTTLTTKEGDMRKVLGEEDLKKMSDSLCVEGFKAYVGNDKKNICQGKATVPDIAYSCVWHESGNAAYAPTPQGPCSLELSEHRESIIVTKSEFTSGPPLAYGTEAQCCFRAAQGPSTNTVVTSPTTTTVTPVVKK